MVSLGLLGGKIQRMEAVKNKKVSIVSCGFDPLHVGHVELMERAKKLAVNSGSKINVTNDPFRAVENTDVLYTDVWVSMGQEKDASIKEKAFEKFQINTNLLRRAKDDVIVMHCLPAHRGMEITDEVLEGEKSVVWRQAENKLHGARGILASVIP